MDIRVSGHQVDVGEALRAHATAELRSADTKYQMRITSAQVTFGKGPHDHGFTCEILAYAPHGLVLKAVERSHDARAAFDAALEKVAKQMRRTSSRHKDHHTTPELAEAFGDSAPPADRRGGA